MPKYPKTPKNSYSGDVAWYSLKPTKNGKRRKKIAYSTQATSDLIAACIALAHEATIEDVTIRELYGMITYDQEAKKVLQAYIKAGEGDMVPHFR